MVTGDKRPTLKELLDCINNYADHWEVISIRLGVSVKIIRKNHVNDCTACFMEALQKWLEATPDPHATWKVLEDAINQTVKLGG